MVITRTDDARPILQRDEHSLVRLLEGSQEMSTKWASMRGTTSFQDLPSPKNLIFRVFIIIFSCFTLAISYITGWEITIPNR